MVKRVCAAGSLCAALACGGEKATVTSPSAAATILATFSLRGTITGISNYTGIPSTPLGGATVSVINGPNAGRSTATDVSGKYVLADLQQSGFTVDVSAVGYVSTSRPVTLASNQTLDVTLTQPPSAIVLSGRVVDAGTTAPISGAIVSINGRYRASTDDSGTYTVAGFLDLGSTSFTYVSAASYTADYRYIHGTTQNVQLYRIDRITAGASKPLTISPGDTLCVNNVQDFPGLGPDYVCRSVYVVAPVDGVMTLEAVSTEDGTRPTMEVKTVDVTPCRSERLENPTSIDVKAGTDVVVHVEMPASSARPQSLHVPSRSR
jgi:hypothetical protein